RLLNEHREVVKNVLMNFSEVIALVSEVGELLDRQNPGNSQQFTCCQWIGSCYGATGQRVGTRHGIVRVKGEKRGDPSNVALGNDEISVVEEPGPSRPGHGCPVAVVLNDAGCIGYGQGGCS